jgi:hypothetical protein
VALAGLDPVAAAVRRPPGTHARPPVWGNRSARPCRGWATRRKPAARQRGEGFGIVGGPGMAAGSARVTVRCETGGAGPVSSHLACALGLAAAGWAVVAGTVGRARAVQQRQAVTFLPMAHRGRDSPGRTTKRPPRRSCQGRPGRAGAPTAGPGRPPERRRSNSARTSAKRSPSKVSVWPQGHWPWSATWSSSPISRSRSPARWAPLDQPQPADGGLVIEPVAGGGAGGLWEQADAFVVADGVGAEAGLVGEGGDGEGHRGRVNLGVHSKVKRAGA